MSSFPVVHVVTAANLSAHDPPNVGSSSTSSTQSTGWLLVPQQFSTQLGSSDPNVAALMLHISKYREQVFRPSCSHGLLLLSLSTPCLRVVLALSSCRRVVPLVRAFRRNAPASRFVEPSPDWCLGGTDSIPHLLSSPPTPAEHLSRREAAAETVFLPSGIPASFARQSHHSDSCSLSPFPSVGFDDGYI